MTPIEVVTVAGEPSDGGDVVGWLPGGPCDDVYGKGGRRAAGTAQRRGAGTGRMTAGTSRRARVGQFVTARRA